MKVSVSVARVSSLTWTVNVKLPAVVGTPLIRPELPAKSNSLVPEGRRPSTTLSDGCLFDDAQPVTVMKYVSSVPTWPVTVSLVTNAGDLLDIADPANRLCRGRPNQNDNAHVEQTTSVSAATAPLLRYDAETPR